MKKQIEWCGNTNCDFCKQPCGDVLYDGKTQGGFWAVMCDKCFNIFGCGLGIGIGQKYNKQINTNKYMINIDQKK